VPTADIVAIINPDNGPGASKDPGYVTGIQQLVSAGVTVVGCVLCPCRGPTHAVTPTSHQNRPTPPPLSHTHTHTHTRTHTARQPLPRAGVCARVRGTHAAATCTLRTASERRVWCRATWTRTQR
jgi:hypothetical protein